MASASIIPYPAASRVVREEGRAIDLADEPDFDLGGLHVAPSTRELLGPNGREVLEPRVMMVLAELARHRGHTVSRDRLVDTCWDGLAVGDDAINRVIGKLRKLAASTGAFEIETITKVGYRLAELGEATATAVQGVGGQPQAGQAGPASATADPTGSRRRRPLVAATLLLAVGVAGLAWGLRPTARPAATPAPVVAQQASIAAALVEQGRAAITEHSPTRVQQGVAQLQEATARDPGSARAWGALALGYSALYFRTPPEDQPALVARAEAAIARALELEPAQADALSARAAMTPAYGNWLAREAIEKDTIRRTGGQGGNYPRFLLGVGRASDALGLAERRSPVALYPQVGRANALFAAGRIDEADRATADLIRLWPQNYLAWFTRVYFLMYSGRAGEAAEMAADRSGWPLDIPPAELELTGQMARAIASRDPSDADAVIRRYDDLATKGQGYMQNGLRVSAALGRPDDAFRFAEMLFSTPIEKMPRERFVGQRNYATGNDRHTDLLFMPPVDRLHDDPRFLDLLTRMGMVDYWKRSGTTPDFCARRQAACRAVGIPLKR